MKGQIKKQFSGISRIRLDRTELYCANLIKSLAIALLLIGTISCAKEEKEVSFAKYSLLDAYLRFNCQFITPLSVLIINDEKELEENLACSFVYPPVDFSKYTMLIVRGTANKAVSFVDVTRFHHVGKKYSIDITVYFNNSQSAESWAIALLVSKLPKDAIINLNIN